MLKIEIPDIDKMIFVATCPRSGSSALTRCLVGCGAFVGSHKAKPLNPLGFYENQEINRIFNFTWIRTGHLPGLATRRKAAEAGEMPNIEFLRERVALALYLDGYRGGTAAFKHALYMFYAEQIQQAFPDALWILPIRDSEEIMDSMHRAEMVDDRLQAIYKLQQFKAGYELVRKTCSNVMEIHTSRLIKDGDTREFEQICKAGGLEFNAEVVAKSLDKSLWNRTAFEIKEAKAKAEGKPPPVRPSQMPDGLYPIGQLDGPVINAGQEN